MVCFHCGKGVLFGRSHTHHRGVAGGRWKKRAPKTQRVFEPNLQKVEVMESGKVMRVKLCTKCVDQPSGNCIPTDSLPWITVSWFDRVRRNGDRGEQS